MSSNPRRRRARPRKRLIIRPPNYAPNRARRNPMPIDTSWTGHKADFISPKGNYGIVPSSELAMSTRIADKPVIQFALFSDKKRWPHVTWAHVMTPDGFVTDGLPSEVLPAEVRRTLGGFGNEKMPKGALQKHEHALNQLKQYAVFRYQYREMPEPKWGAVDATGPFPRGTNWRDLLPPGVLSKPGILGICAKTKSDAIWRGMNEFALHGGKAVGKNPRASDNPRKVHQMIVRAFLDGRNAKAGSHYRTDGKTLWVRGNVVAAKQADGIMLRDAGWRTLLTKNVLNELLQQMGIPGGIRQVKRVWMLGDRAWPGSVVAPYKTLPQPVNGTATNPRSGRQNPIVDGTTYKGSTPRRVIEILEANRRNRGPRLRIWYGDAKTGAAWGDTEAGHVGRSTGSIKIPLVISRRTSMGGGGILDAHIVRIEYASKARGGVLYQHPRFHIPAGKTPWIKRNPCGNPPSTDLTIRKTFQGALSISAIVGGYLVTRQYMGYTKREAIAMFRSYIKTMKRNPLTRKAEFAMHGGKPQRNPTARAYSDTRSGRLKYSSKEIFGDHIGVTARAGETLHASRLKSVPGGMITVSKTTFRDNPRSCKMCGGPLIKMGGLGNLMWYRCRNCGMETSVKK